MAVGGLRTESATSKLDALFQWAEGKNPGAAVGIVCGEEILLKKAYGLAGVETGAPVTPNTRFLVASLTKQFTAMGAMILHEAGELDYDHPVSKFLPEFSEWGRLVSVRHLLTHTSGLEDYENLFIQQGRIDTEYPTASKEPHRGFQPTFTDTVELLSHANLRFSPGEEWEYSNSGYVVLAAIIERIAGQSLAQFVAASIFKPLSMDDSFLGEQVLEVPNAANSYECANGDYKEIDYTPLNAVYGPNGIYSTVDDMVKWCLAIGTNQLVNQRTMSEGFESGRLTNGARHGYGFGWYTASHPAGHWISHTGSWCGFRALILCSPEQRFGLVVLANNTRFNDVARSATAAAVRNIYLPETNVPRLRPRNADLSRYVGQYRSQYGETIELTAGDGELVVRTHLSLRLQLMAQSAIKFLVRGSEADSYFFHEDNDGNIAGVTRHLSLFGYSRDAYTLLFKAPKVRQ